MFKKVNLNILVCDKCGATLDIFEEGATVFLASNDIEQLKKYATEYDTWEEKDGKMYCGDCLDKAEEEGTEI